MSAVEYSPQDRYTHTCRLLIVDADAAARQVYRDLLQPIGCDIIDATDGRVALVHALVHRPSLVITETRLPGFDGYQLLDVLRRDITTREVPVLFVTSDSRESALKRARDSGADSVLVKPFSPEALLREVQRLLEQQEHRPTSATAASPRTGKGRATVRTMAPPATPPLLLCPLCDQPLTYEHSHMGGVKSHAEQWDTFKCSDCGAFEYRQRTRKLRRLA